LKNNQGINKDILKIKESERCCQVKSIEGSPQPRGTGFTLRFNTLAGNALAKRVNALKTG